MRLRTLFPFLLLLIACAPAYQPTELVVSERFGLRLVDTRLISHSRDGDVEIVELEYPANSPYRPWKLEDFSKLIERQLEARLFQRRCFRQNIPLIEPSFITFRMSRGTEGIGVHLRPLGLYGYRIEVAPTPADPPFLSCPPR